MAGRYLLTLGLQGEMQQRCGQGGPVEQRHGRGCAQEAYGETQKMGGGPRVEPPINYKHRPRPVESRKLKLPEGN